MVDNTVSTICYSLSDRVIHEVCRELTSWLAASFKTPNDTIAVTSIINLNNSNILLWLKLNVL